MTTPLMSPPNTGVITAKGTKGLLLWIQQSMPDFYAQLSPQLVAQQKLLNGLSCGPNLSALYAGSYAGRGAMAGMGAIGDYYTTSVATDPAITADPYDISAPSDLNIPSGSDTTNAASVASTNSTSSSLASVISAAANAVKTGTLAAAQVSANNTLLQTNLQRAQQGLAPLTATTAGTIVNSSSSLLLLGIAAVAVIVLGKKSS